MYEQMIATLHTSNILYQSGKLNPNAQRLISSDNQVVLMVVECTSFLPEDVEMRERLFCIVQGIDSPVLCEVCEVPLRVKKSGRLEYPTYCSRTCMHQSKKRTDRRTSTMVARYGVEYTAQSDDLHDKMKDTCVDRFGVDNPFKSSDIQKKASDTIMRVYGVTNVMADPEIVIKQKLGCIKKDHKSIVNKIKTSTYVNNGYYNIRQQHLSDHQLELLNDKQWLHNKHHTEQLTLGEIATEIGVEGTVVGNRFAKFGISVQRFAWSVGEKEVVAFLGGLGIEVVSGDRTILSGRELDMYLPAFNLAIEYCGLYWHADCHARIDKHYHSKKHKDCERQGIQLITIFEDEWQLHHKQVTNKLMSLLGLDSRPVVFARKTSIVAVTTEQKKQFMDTYHIQGSGPGSVTIGLDYQGELVACMSFIKQSHTYVLNRYATSHRVVGGVSRLLAHFKKTNDWDEIVSFADLRWSDGNLYDKTGWTLDSTIPPDYSYSPDGKNRHHKFGFRRKHLPKKLKYFDPSLTERENCDNNGILRIWDCGKLRYIMHNDK